MQNRAALGRGGFREALDEVGSGLVAGGFGGDFAEPDQSFGGTTRDPSAAGTSAAFTGVGGVLKLRVAPLKF